MTSMSASVGNDEEWSILHLRVETQQLLHNRRCRDWPRHPSNTACICNRVHHSSLGSAPRTVSIGLLDSSGTVPSLTEYVSMYALPLSRM